MPAQKTGASGAVALAGSGRVDEGGVQRGSRAWTAREGVRGTVKKTTEGRRGAGKKKQSWRTERS